MSDERESIVEKAVTDRIVDGTRAVLIIGDPPEREQIIPKVQLPE